MQKRELLWLGIGAALILALGFLATWWLPIERFQLLGLWLLISIIVQAFIVTIILIRAHRRIQRNQTALKERNEQN